MPTKPKPKPDDPEQSKRFREAAKEVEADLTGTVFDKALDLVVPAEAKTAPKPRPTTKP
jgi:hypothetical protein